MEKWNKKTAKRFIDKLKEDILFDFPDAEFIVDFNPAHKGVLEIGSVRNWDRGGRVLSFSKKVAMYAPSIPSKIRRRLLITFDDSSYSSCI